MKSGPCSPQLEKALAQKRRLDTTKNKKNKNKKIDKNYSLLKKKKKMVLKTHHWLITFFCYFLCCGGIYMVDIWWYLYGYLFPVCFQWHHFGNLKSAVVGVYLHHNNRQVLQVRAFASFQEPIVKRLPAQQESYFQWGQKDTERYSAGKWCNKLCSLGRSFWFFFFFIQTESHKNNHLISSLSPM